MFEWVIYRPPKILKYIFENTEAKLQQIVAIVTTHSVLLFQFN